MAALIYMLEVRELAEEENLTEFDIISQWRTVDEQMKELFQWGLTEQRLWQE